MRAQPETRTTVANLIPSDLGRVGVPRALRNATIFWGNSLRIASFCLVAYWIAIFIGTHLPSAAMPRIGSGDKLLHFGAFGGLAFLVAWALPTREGRTLQRAAWTLGLIIGYAILDELTQKFIPGRTCSLGDCIADSIGAMVGLLAYFAIKAILVRTKVGQKLIWALSK